MGEKKLKAKFSPAKSFYNYRNNDFQRVNSLLNDNEQIKTLPDEMPIDQETYFKVLKNNQEISGNLNSKKFSQRSDNYGYIRHSSTPGISPVESAKTRMVSPMSDVYSELLGPNSKSPMTNASRKGVSLAVSKSQFSTGNPSKIQPSSFHPLKSARSHLETGIGSDNNLGGHPPQTSQTARSIYNMSQQEIQDLEKKLKAKNKLQIDRAKVMSQHSLVRKDNKRDISHLHEKNSVYPSITQLPEINHRPIPSLHDDLLASPRPMSLDPIKTEPDSRVSIEKNHTFHTPRIKKNMYELLQGDQFSLSWNGEPLKKTNSLSANSKKAMNETSILFHPQNTVSSFALNSPTTNDLSNKKYMSATLDKFGPFQNTITLPGTESFAGSFLQKTSLFSARGRPEIKTLGKEDLEDILNDLKRELPDIATGAPASRQDVIVLNSWIDSKIQQVTDDAIMKEEEKNAMCDKFYTVCLNEIFRQISVECTERADLLFRIWTSYFKLFNLARNRTEAENKNLKTLYQDENQKQYEWYQKLITKREQELEDAKLDIQKILKEKDEENQRLEKLIEKDLKSKEDKHQIKGIISKLKKEIDELKEENARYARRLAYKIANTNKGTYVPTFLTHNTGNPAAPKDVGREASIPSNLGVGSSITTPLKSSRAASSPKNDDYFLKVVEEEHNLASSSISSLQSSLDFIYEDTETQAKQVFRIDQLNNNAVVYKRNITLGPDAENNEEIRVIGIETAEKETQTNLALTENKYNDVFEGQKALDELISEVRIKKEVDILAENNLFASLDFSKIFELPEQKDSQALRRDFSQFSTGTKTLEDKMDGIGKSPASKGHLDIKKHATEPRRRRRSSVGNEPSSFSPSNNGGSPKMEEFYMLMKKILESEVFNQEQSPSINRQRRTSTEEYKITLAPKEPVIKLTTPTVNNKNPTLLLWAEPIQEQLESNEDGRSVSRLDPENSIMLPEGTTKDNLLKSTNTVDEKLESVNKSQDLVTPSNKDIQQQQDLPQSEEKITKSVSSQTQTEQEEEEEAEAEINEEQELKNNSRVIKERIVISRVDSQVRKESSKNNSVSYEVDDLFHGLDDAASDYGSTYKADKFGSRNAFGDHSITDGDASPPMRIKLNYATSMEVSHVDEDPGTKGTTSNILSLEQMEDGHRKPMSFTHLISTKNKIHKMASMFTAKKDDFSVVDKARLIMVLRMYKVEKEKVKDLQSSVSELEEQLLTEKQNQIKLHQQTEEMQTHIKLLEQLKAKCPHGRCAACKGEADDSAYDKQSIEYSLDIETNPSGSPKALYKVREEDEDEVNQEGEEDEEAGTDEIDVSGDTQEIDSVTGSILDVDRGIKRQRSLVNSNRHQKMPKKKATVGLEPELGKKKGKQTVSAAFAIIAKIQDKKLAKFKNFMPMKAVLKQIHSLYNERINQMKENNVWREEEFCVFAYKNFLNTFGFRKIAEQKFIIFLLSVKKYLYILRINLFARFMTLIQGPSNFTNDEFNKYLECIEFINNSTLGTNIANSDTDSKIYTPFLRGLEYLRHFSENKMNTDEYIEFKREFENIKENDPKNINRNGIIDVDLFMTKVLAKYRVICSRTKQFVVNAFKAADLDGNKYCSLKEFIMIYRNIEHDKFDEGFAENIFSENADIKIEGEINLSFDKFTVVCVEYGLFSDLQQDIFLGIHTAQALEEDMESLKNNWVMHHLDIDTKLSEASKISREEKVYWKNILNVLNERITQFQQIDPNNYKPLLIAFKILEREVERLSDNEIERDQYGVKKISVPPSNEIKKS